MAGQWTVFPDPPRLRECVIAAELGILPKEGGWLDQDADFTDELEAYLAELKRVQSEALERR